MLTFLGQAVANPEAASAVETVTDPSVWMTFLTEKGPALGIQVLGAIAILLVGRFIAGMVRRFLKKVMTKRGVDPSLTGFIGSLAYFALMAFTVIAVVGQFGAHAT